ncbi:MAG TPA: hypothetical protein PLJ47_03700 [Candidatus Hydrogenedentes bacterium]|nr:hypothetical protein [Candidatus Hydrogenedentota bacterium]HRK33678.1 hypothetical protein [Candidatus Hydrogenedentota bacterium]
MRIPGVAAAACLFAVCAFAQRGLSGQDAQDPELTRALDAASVAIAAAQRAAAEGRVVPFKDALNNAGVRWAECYGKYREWPTADTAWRSNFDSINTNLLNAVNAITPGNNMAAAKAQVDAAASTLTGLKNRNGVVDIRLAASSLDTALQNLTTTITGLQGRPLTPADVDALKTSYGAVRDGWLLFSQATIDYNALGFEPGRLERYRETIALHTIGIDSINNILSNPDTRTLVTQWQSVRDQLVALLKEVNGEMDTVGVPVTDPVTTPTDAAKAIPDRGGTGPAPETPTGRPRLLPRLRDR